MVWFSQRMAIERSFVEWAERNGIAQKPNAVVAFLAINGCLDEEKIGEKFPFKIEIRRADGEPQST